MAIKETIKKGISTFKTGWDKVFIFLCLCTSSVSFADGIIPISGDDTPSSNSDFAQTIIKIFQKDIIPLMIIAGAVWILWTAISLMSNGVKEAQELKKFDPLKNAIIKTAVVIVVGGVVLYLMNTARTYSFTS